MYSCRASRHHKVDVGPRKLFYYRPLQPRDQIVSDLQVILQVAHVLGDGRDGDWVGFGFVLVSRFRRSFAILRYAVFILVLMSLLLRCFGLS